MSRYANQNEIAAILTTGDNFYTDNADFLMQPFEWATAGEIEFWITWGNHDIETGERIDALNTTFQSPPRGAVHEWGEVDVIILDSTQVVSSEQTEFLINTLDDSSRSTIVVFHHPVVSCSNHRDTREVLERWVSLFDDDVFLVLNGHDHFYQRFVSDNITYVVTGGGGRRLHDVGTCPGGDPSPLAAERRFHFVALEQTNQSLIIQAIDVNGVVFDEARIAMP